MQLYPVGSAGNAESRARHARKVRINILPARQRRRGSRRATGCAPAGPAACGYGTAPQYPQSCGWLALRSTVLRRACPRRRPSAQYRAQQSRLHRPALRRAPSAPRRPPDGWGRAAVRPPDCMQSPAVHTRGSQARRGSSSSGAPDSIPVRPLPAAQNNPSTRRGTHKSPDPGRR